MNFKFKRRNSLTPVISKDTNRAFKDISTDLYDLMIDNLQMSARIDAETAAASDTVGALVSTVNSLETTLLSGSPAKTFISAFGTDYLSYPTSAKETEKATHHSEYGHFVLPILEQTTQLMNLNPETGELTLRDDASDFITQYLTNNKYTDRVNAVYQNEVTDAFTPGTHVFFLRTLATNPLVENVQCVFHIRLPVTSDVNTIKLIPLPEFNIGINSIKISTSLLTHGTIRDIFGIPVEFPVTKASRGIWHMQTQPTSEVIITLDQSVYELINGAKQFRMGARFIAIENNVYANVGYIKIRIPYNASYPSLQGIVMDWSVDTQSKVFLYTSETDADALNDQYIMQSSETHIIPANPVNMSGNDFFMVVELRPINATGATPIFRGCVATRV